MKLRGNLEISAKELVSSYDDLFNDNFGLRDTDAFYYWILYKLNPRSGQRLLDIGCGEGHLVKFANRRGLLSIGIDLSVKGTAIARKTIGSSIIALADGEVLPFKDESFDLITNVGSLEHFIDPLAGIREMCRVLKKEGLAAIVLPNSYYLADIIWHVWRTGYGVSHRQPLERFSTFREWWDFLEEGGLEVIEAYKYNFMFPRTINDWRWYFRYPRKLLNLMIAPITPFNLSYHFLYVCHK